MPRFYYHCSTCRRRMRLIGKSSETFGRPPTPSERYYRCQQCEVSAVFLWPVFTRIPDIPDIERNFMWAGLPDHLTEDDTPP
jgi:hypothetical protein